MGEGINTVEETSSEEMMKKKKKFGSLRYLNSEWIDYGIVRI